MSMHIDPITALRIAHAARDEEIRRAEQFRRRQPRRRRRVMAG